MMQSEGAGEAEGRPLACLSLTSHLSTAMRCPPHSHYSLCVNPCPAACAGVQEVVQLPTPCAEGCQCDDGFFPAKGDCVPVDHCSCFHNGLYFPVSILLGPC